MRRFDKKYNIQKANMLSEQRYLESKGLINEQEMNEYDIDSFDRNYKNLPKNRKDNVKDFLNKRQETNGYRLRSVNKDEAEDYNKNFKSGWDNGSWIQKNEKQVSPDLFITSDDLKGGGNITLKDKLNANVLTKVGNIIKVLNDYGKGNLSGAFSKIYNEYKINPDSFIDTSKTPFDLKDEIEFKTSFSIWHAKPENDNGRITLSVEVSGSLNKMEKNNYYPPYKVVINKITIEHAGLGVYIPADNEARNFIMNRIKEIIKENYKFSNNKNIFVKEVNIDRNSFYKS